MTSRCRTEEEKLKLKDQIVKLEKEVERDGKLL